MRLILTITIWTAPHAQVAEASSSFDQPSLVWPWQGNAVGFSAAVDIVVRGNLSLWIDQELGGDELSYRETACMGSLTEMYGGCYNLELNK